MRFGKVSGGKGGLLRRKFNFLKPPEASFSMFINA
jgi:hypothetical protein